jgi:hypothetical protein
MRATHVEIPSGKNPERIVLELESIDRLKRVIFSDGATSEGT